MPSLVLLSVAAKISGDSAMIHVPLFVSLPFSEEGNGELCDSGIKYIFSHDSAIDLGRSPLCIFVAAGVSGIKKLLSSAKAFAEVPAAVKKEQC